MVMYRIVFEKQALKDLIKLKAANICMERLSEKGSFFVVYIRPCIHKKEEDK